MCTRGISGCVVMMMVVVAFCGSSKTLYAEPPVLMNRYLAITAESVGQQAVRVTFTDGFDAMAIFNRAGNQIAWTTGRSGGKGAQVFTATWDDAGARRALGLPPASAPPVSRKFSRPGLDAARMRAHVQHLASDELEGRAAGSAGEAKATAYVAAELQKIGLTPAASARPGSHAAWIPLPILLR